MPLQVTRFEEPASENSGDKGSSPKNSTATEKEAPEEEEEPFYEIGSDPNLKAAWKNGLELNSAQKDFRVHVGGRTQFDSSWFHSDPQVNENDPSLAYPIQDGVDFRRARLRVDGTMYETIDWAAEYDFVNSSQVLTSNSGPSNSLDFPAPTDLWFHFKEVPWVGNIRVGNHKEPIGMEHLISSQHLPFMERSFNQDAFYGAFNNGFAPGISIFDDWHEERGTWAIGIFKPTTNPFASSNVPGDSSVTGRVTWLPQYQDDGAYLLHLGISARHTSLAANDVRFRTRGPEQERPKFLRPLFADTGNLFWGKPADDQFRAREERRLVDHPIGIPVELRSGRSRRRRYSRRHPLLSWGLCGDPLFPDRRVSCLQDRHSHLRAQSFRYRMRSSFELRMAPAEAGGLGR